MAGRVERPKPETDPSRLASIGRYALEPEVFDILRALPLQGQRYDAGSKLGDLEAMLDFALEHPVLGGPFTALIDE